MLKFVLLVTHTPLLHLQHSPHTYVLLILFFSCFFMSIFHFKKSYNYEHLSLDQLQEMYSFVVESYFCFTNHVKSWKGNQYKCSIYIQCIYGILFSLYF